MTLTQGPFSLDNWSQVQMVLDIKDAQILSQRNLGYTNASSRPTMSSAPHDTRAEEREHCGYVRQHRKQKVHNIPSQFSWFVSQRTWSSEQYHISRRLHIDTPIVHRLKHSQSSQQWFDFRHANPRTYLTRVVVTLSSGKSSRIASVLNKRQQDVWIERRWSVCNR